MGVCYTLKFVAFTQKRYFSSFMYFYKIIAESDDDQPSQGDDSDQDPAYDPTADLQPSDEDLSQDEEPQHRPVREPQMETVRGKCVVECLIGCSNNPCSISLL